jgi:hypothetical protein
VTYPNKLRLRSVENDLPTQNAADALVGANHFGSILDFRVEELARQFGNSGEKSEPNY